MADSFLIAVNAPVNSRALMKLIVGTFPDLKPIPRSGHKSDDVVAALCGILRGHYVEVVCNDFPLQTTESPSGNPFKDFPLRLECVPVEEGKVTADQQLTFAQELISVLGANGYEFAVAADFTL